MLKLGKVAEKDYSKFGFEINVCDVLRDTGQPKARI
jgi:hypothetical protein